MCAFGSVQGRLAAARAVILLALGAMWFGGMSLSLVAATAAVAYLLWSSNRPLPALVFTVAFPLLAVALAGSGGELGELGALPHASNASVGAVPGPRGAPVREFDPKNNALTEALAPALAASAASAVSTVQLEEALTMLAAPGMTAGRAPRADVEIMQASAKDRLVALGMAGVRALASKASQRLDGPVARDALVAVVQDAVVAGEGVLDKGTAAKVAAWPAALKWGRVAAHAGLPRAAFDRSCATLMIRDLHLASALAQAGISVVADSAPSRDALLETVKAAGLALDDADVALLGSVVYREAESRTGGDHTALDAVPRYFMADIVNDLATAGESTAALAAVIDGAYSEAPQGVVSEAEFTAALAAATADAPALIPQLLKAVSSVIFDMGQPGAGFRYSSHGALEFLFVEMDLSGDGLVTLREVVYFLDSLRGLHDSPLDLVLELVRAAWKSPRDLASLVIPLQRRGLFTAVETDAYYDEVVRRGDSSKGATAPAGQPTPVSPASAKEDYLNGAAVLAFAGRPEAVLTAAGDECAGAEDDDDDGIVCSRCGEGATELVVHFSGSPPWNAALTKDGSLYLWLFNITASPHRVAVTEDGEYGMFNQTGVSLLHFTQPTSSLLLASERIFTDSHCTGFVRGKVTVVRHAAPRWRAEPRVGAVCVGDPLAIYVDGNPPFTLGKVAADGSAEAVSLPANASSHAVDTSQPGVIRYEWLADAHCNSSASALVFEAIEPPSVRVVGSPSRSVCPLPSGGAPASIALSFTGTPPFHLSYTTQAAGDQHARLASVTVPSHSYTLQAQPGVVQLLELRDASQAQCSGSIDGGDTVAIEALPVPSAEMWGELDDGRVLDCGERAVLAEGASVDAVVSLMGTPPFRVELDDGRVFDGIESDELRFKLEHSSRVCVRAVGDGLCPHGTVTGCVTLSLQPKPRAWLELPPPSVGVPRILLTDADVAGYCAFAPVASLGDGERALFLPTGESPEREPTATVAGVFYEASAVDDGSELMRCVARKRANMPALCVPASTYAGIDDDGEWPPRESLAGMSFPKAGIVRVCSGASAMRVHLQGTPPFTLRYTINGESVVERGLRSRIHSIPVTSVAQVELVSVVDANFEGTVDATPLRILLAERPQVSLSAVGDGGQICPGDKVTIAIELGASAVLPTLIKVRNRANPSWRHTALVSERRTEIAVESTGSYYVEQVLDGVCFGDPSGSVEVAYLERPAVRVSGGGALCPGAAGVVRLDASGIGPWQLEHWFLPAGAASGAAVVNKLTLKTSPHLIEVHEEGRHWVEAVTDSRCSGSASGTAEVVLRPVPSAIVAQLSVCVDDVINVVLEGSPPFQLGYTLGSSEEVREQVAGHEHVVVPRSAGEFGLQWVADAYCASEPGTLAEASVVVDARPRAVLLSEAEGGVGSGQLCAAGPTHNVVSLVVELEGVAPFKLVYKRRGESELRTSIATGVRHLIQVAEPGVYELLEVHDSLCGRGEAHGMVSVETLPMPRAQLSGGEYVVCSGDSADIRIDTQGNGPWRVAYTDGDEVWRVEMDEPSRVLEVSKEGRYELLGVGDAHCAYCVDEAAAWCTEFIVAKSQE
ncbi:uncharacterized protein AMSG_03830 [Thecamonas trahens ATCC 50062]|uniref:Nucleoporin POM152 Ig-like domain-containing protein n=1 Tax=Thecamonas trahens ATCC 50062 TaxID=461836 RepID=A0A0L0D5N1_THETB|nr:hypothetical protein AMSG_03830 [Thecamonas trahens ATCC 50062]KNC47396.1 hypothetical protein AMSG_03830 [Thecamonas trahens ATCC 50062]|eukprot:XP_013759734.1 hypothetical protein AMSG_03830 [Thecamonas trahens ATCC 50062]